MKKYFIVLLLLANYNPLFPVVGEEGKEWKAPEEPKNTEEAQKLEQTIEEQKKSIEDKDASDPQVQFEQQKIKANEAVLDTFNADEQLRANSNDLEAQEQRRAAQKELADAIKTIEQQLESGFKPVDDGGTTLPDAQKIKKEYAQELTTLLNKAYQQHPNSPVAEEMQKLQDLKNEFNALKSRSKSLILPDIDYATLDKTVQKEVLIELADKLDILRGGSNLDAQSFNTLEQLLQDVKNRLTEVQTFKPGAPLTGNALGTKLNLSTLLPEDRLSELKKEFTGKRFLDSYKTEQEKTKAFADLNNALIAYDIPFSDFYGLSTAKNFITYLIQDAKTDGDKQGVIAQVLNDARSTSSFILQKTKLNALDAVLTDALKQYPNLSDQLNGSKKDIAERIAQINKYNANPPTYTDANALAKKLNLSKKIPADQISAINQEYFASNKLINDFIKEKGADLSKWSIADLKEFQSKLQPMRDLLEEVSKAPYNLGTLYPDRIKIMNDILSNGYDRVQEALEKKQTVLPDAATDALNVALETGQVKVGEIVGKALDPLNSVLNSLVVKKSELRENLAATAEQIAGKVAESPEMLAMVKYPIDVLLKTHLLDMGAEGNVVLGKIVGSKAAAVIRLVGEDKVKAVAEFVMSPEVKDLAERLGAVGKAAQSVAQSEQALNQAVQREVATMTGDKKKVAQLDAIAKADALIKQQISEYNNPRKKGYFESARDMFVSFAKDIASWIKSKVGGDRYNKAAQNYVVTRSSFFKFFKLDESSSIDQIKEAIVEKSKVDPKGAQEALNDVSRAITSMVKVIKEDQKIIDAAQGNFLFLIDIWKDLGSGYSKEKASAADIVNAFFDANQKKTDYLQAAQEGIDELQKNLAVLAPQGTYVVPLTTQFVEGLKRTVVDNLAGEIAQNQDDAESLGKALANIQEGLRKEQESKNQSQQSSSDGSWGG